MADQQLPALPEGAALDPPPSEAALPPPPDGATIDTPESKIKRPTGNFITNAGKSFLSAAGEGLGQITRAAARVPFLPQGAKDTLETLGTRAESRAEELRPTDFEQASPVTSEVTRGVGGIVYPGIAAYLNPVAGVAAFAGQGQQEARESETQRVAQLSDADLAKIPRYNELLQTSMTPAQARSQFSDEASQNAANVGAASGAALGLVPGNKIAAPLERAAGKGLAKLVRPRIADIVAHGVGEAGLFSGINAAGQFVQNVTDAIPTSPGQGVLDAAASGLAPGFVLGAGRRVISRPRAAEAAPPSAAPGAEATPDQSGSAGTPPPPDGATIDAAAPPAAPAEPVAVSPASPPIDPNAGPISRAAADAVNRGATQPQADAAAAANPPPPIPWVDPTTGEFHEPTDTQIKDQFHQLFDRAQAAGAAPVRTLPDKNMAEEWGVPLKRLKDLRTQAMIERKAGFRYGDQRAAEPEQTSLLNQEDANAAQAGQVPQNDQLERPNADAGGQAAEAGGGDRAEHGAEQSGPRDAAATAGGADDGSPAAAAAATRGSDGQEGQGSAADAVEQRGSLLDQYAQRQQQIDALNEKRKAGDITADESNQLHDLRDQQERVNPVSGLPNRKAFDDAMSSGDYSHAVALDVDGFKAINDTFGHGVGDSVLQHLGQHLADNSNGNISFFHLSGDEYAALVKGEPTERVTQLQADMAKQPFEVSYIDANGHEVQHTLNGLGVTFGVGKNLHDADIAANASKEQRAAAGLRRRREDIRSAPAGSEVVQAPEGSEVAQGEHATGAAGAERSGDAVPGAERPAADAGGGNESAVARDVPAPGGHSDVQPSASDSKGSVRPDRLSGADGTIGAGENQQPTPDEGASAAERHGHDVRAVAENPVDAPAVEAAARDAATHPENPKPEPTPAQKEAGNYSKGHVRLHGLDISIENPAGTSRRPEWPPLKNTYGYIRRTLGADGDHVDAFLGPHAEDATKPVFVVDQKDPKTGRFDEHKVMLGFATGKEARKAYQSNYHKAWNGFDGITRMSMEQFKDWLKHGDTKMPITAEAVRRASEDAQFRAMSEELHARARAAEEKNLEKTAATVQAQLAKAAGSRRAGDGSFRKGPSDEARGAALVQDARDIVAEATKQWGQNAPHVKVVGTPDDLPPRAKREPGYQKARAYYDGRSTAYVVASKHASRESIKRSLLHEAVGHHGIENILNDHVKGGWDRLVSDIKALRESGKGSEQMRDILAAVDRRYKGSSDTVKAKETLAIMAERGVRNGLLSRVIAAIKAFARKLFPDMKFGERDLVELLRKSDEYIHAGETNAERQAAVGALAFEKRAGTFYSALNEALTKATGAPKKGGKALKAWLDGAQRRGEFKGGEREWLGVDQWLDEHPDATRSELQDFVREHAVDVSVVRKPSEISKDEHAQRLFEKPYAELDSDERSEVDQVATSSASQDAPKYERHTLPGGKNYREHLLTIPERAPGDAIELGPRGWGDTGGGTRMGDTANFRGGHYDEPNILAHVRMNDRTTADGKSALHIEEIQSDWHQKGRRKGYDDGVRSTPVYDRGSGMWHVKDRDGTTSAFLSEADANRYAAQGGEAVPNAPLKGTEEWAMLGFKHALREAVETGKDRVTWTTGDQQAERYDLGHQVESITAEHAGEGRYEIEARLPDGNEQRIGEFSAEGLSDAVGKDLADRIVKEVGSKNQGPVRYAGADLKIGGEGMRGFYDKILPKAVAKYVKQWGGKVGKSEMSAPRLVGRYDGPELTPDQMERFDSTATVQQQLRAAARRVRAGEPFERVATDEFSPAAAEAVGGKMVPHDDKMEVHSVDITPAMRAAVEEGQPLFDKRDEGDEASKIPFDKDADPSTNPGASVENLGKVLAKPDGSVLDRAKAWIRGKAEDFKPAALGALQLRHLIELMENSVPLRGAAFYKELEQRMTADRLSLMTGDAEKFKADPENMLAKGASNIASDLQKFARAKGLAGWFGRIRPEAKKLFDVMHEATSRGVDPDIELTPTLMENARGDFVEWSMARGRERIKELRGQMRGRPGEDKGELIDQVKLLKKMPVIDRMRKEIWPKLRAAYMELPPEAQELYRNMRDWYSQHSDQVEQALLERIDALKGEDIKASYIASMKDRIRFQFESSRRQGVYFPLNRNGDFWLALKDNQGRDAFKMFETAGEFDAAAKKLKAAGFKITAQGRKDGQYRAKDAPSGTFVADVIKIMKKSGAPEKVQDEVYQSFLKTLPELSMRKHAIHRQNVPGFDENAMRTFAKNSFHGAHQLARLRYGYKMQGVMDGMKLAVDNWRQGAEFGGATSEPAMNVAHVDALLGELQKRHDWIMSPKDSNLANMANAAGFMYYLGGGPSAALVNLTQNAQVTLPVLGARHGWGKAAPALAAAMRDAIRTGGNIDRTLTSDEERQALRVLRERGDITNTQAHTLAGLAEGNTLTSNPAWATVMRGMSYFFDKTEQINRQAAAIASFRLARGAGMAFDDAVRYTSDIVAGTHGDYSSANRARYMQGSVAKVLTQFRSYTLMMAWNVYRNLYQSFRGESAETRALARKTFTGMMGMTTLLSGVMGLPFLGAARYVANAYHAAFGNSDEPWDFDTEFRNWLTEHLGNDAGRWIATGAVNRVTGADLASRVSLADQWTREPDHELEGNDAYYNLLESIAGPLGGMAKSWFVGNKEIADGNAWRGVETMMPKVVKDTMKSIRFAHEGANTLRGDPLIDDVTTPEEFIQLLGFTPTRLAEQYKENSALKNYSKQITDKRQALLNAFAMAIRLSDDDLRSATLARIQAFNSTNPEIAISPGALRSALSARARAHAETVHGVRLGKKVNAAVRDAAGAPAQ